MDKLTGTVRHRPTITGKLVLQVEVLRPQREVPDGYGFTDIIPERYEWRDAKVQDLNTLGCLCTDLESGIAHRAEVGHA